MAVSVHGIALAAPSSPSSPATVGCGSGGCGGNFYGANINWIVTATSHWPQAAGNWCGVANIQAIDIYDWIKYDGNSNPSGSDQQSIANMLNSSSAVSPWGQAHTVPGDPGPAFVADIAADGGTDPRAIAWGAWNVSPNGYYYHNWIYRTTNTTATYDFASDFGPANGVNDPISVTINTGEHSFIVDGVWASSDPSAGGETIYDIDTWDPSVGEPNTNSYNSANPEAWSLYDWLNYQYPHGSVLWSTGYYTGNGYDPDPSTNPGYYVGSFPNFGDQHYHWNGYYVTIEQDYVTACQASPNIAYSEDGSPAPYNGAQYCP